MKPTLQSSVYMSVFIWYFCAVVSVTSSRAIMIQFPHPYILTFCQFSIASIISISAAIYLGATMDTFYATLNKYVVIIGVSYTAGFIFTNIAFSLVNPSFIETVKSAEPISSVILGYLFCYEYVTWTTYSSLIPICVGVALACVGGSKNSFHSVGFLMAAISNLCFSARAVAAKRLFRKLGISSHKEEGEAVSSANKSHKLLAPIELQIDPVSDNYGNSTREVLLFAQVSVIGCLMLIVFVAVFDGELVTNMVKSQIQLLLYTGDGGDHGGAGHTSTTNVILWFSSMWPILWLWAMNGTAYTLYNLFSFIVLQRTTVATHAVLNAARRVVIIVSTCFLFQTPFHPVQICGIAMALGGVMCFAVSTGAGQAGVNTAITSVLLGSRPHHTDRGTILQQDPIHGGKNWWELCEQGMVRSGDSNQHQYRL